MKLNSIFAIACSAIMLASCSSKGEQITAAGATFPLPFYNLAIKNYGEMQPTQVTYGGIGSGGGIRSLRDKVVNIAGSDAYLSEKEMSEMGGEVIHIPTCMGAVVVAYNLDGIESLNLTNEIISDIYTGKITNWNDEKITKVNKGITFPDLQITPAYRSDGSGTTFVFSDYMNKVNADWAKSLGCGKALKFTTGIAAKGNPGVAGVIKQTPGAIGYIGSEYAFALKIATAAIQNPKGNFIMANDETISASANGDVAPDLRMMITASDVDNAYPISCFTWMVIFKEQSLTSQTLASAQESVKFLRWMISPEAQKMTSMVHYSPLPQKAIEVANSLLDGVTFNGSKLQ